jgi:hypothetical protein
MFRLDRRLFSATVYPADYGFILDTLAGDGDLLDALVLVDEPTFPGCLIIARPVAVYRLRDEAGEDASWCACRSGSRARAPPPAAGRTGRPSSRSCRMLEGERQPTSQPLARAARPVPLSRPSIATLANS